jgi:CheY-like chemotaxis protein
MLPFVRVNRLLQMPKKPYILIADDDPEDQEMIIELLRQRLPDASIKTVPGGREAMKWLSECAGNELPSLILLDYKMPGMTGADVLQATERDPSYRVIPKVIWSTSSNPEYVGICKRYGAIQYFVKPNDLAGLARIADALKDLFVATSAKRGMS